MKLSNALTILFSSSLLALAACGTSTIGGGSGAGGSGGGANTGGSSDGLCGGEPSPEICIADSECPAGYRCLTDPDPTACHPSSCTCTGMGWQCTEDCGMGGGTCGKIKPVDCSSLGAFDKDCATDADCVTKLHQINCCGTRVAVGINTSGSAAFDTFEATCAAQFPACGCAQQPTTAEDGHTMPDFSDDIPVACKAGKCTTYIPAAGLCNGVPSPEDCSTIGCPDGWTCTPDPDPTACHPSNCICGAGGWGCDDICKQNGSICVKGL